jgi:DNA-binding CsgD family transcriptional regulator
MRGLVAQPMEHDEIAVQWMIRSAIVDMKLGIRDYAAFKSVAEYCTTHDIERSMRYMPVMMEDVQAFISRLRPWQDAMIWPEIEKGYHDYTERMTSIQTRYIYMLALLVVTVIALLIYLVLQNHRLDNVRKRMHRANEQLNTSVEDLKQVNACLTELNGQIAEANGVKEEYIGIFLQVCSEYIDKMVYERRHIIKSLRAGKSEELRKELDYTKLEQEELKQLYNLFDSTFLRLYPTFVDELNALLTEDSRIEVKKGELLNTQLRIFALIRLGINDTPRIATLLHCSLSTIYNYRSRIRYNTSITRDEFEARIRTIGSFSRSN